MREFFIKIVESFFGKENVDSTDKCYIVIYFPEIKIRNEFNESRVLTDIYVRVCVDDDGKIKPEISLIRGSVTFQEYKCGYMHSHVISTSYFNYYRHICLGSGPIVDTINVIDGIITRGESCAEMYRLFCMQLKILLETESIAGVPYISMSTINDSERCEKIISFIKQCYRTKLDDKIIDFIKELCKTRPFNFSYFKGFYRIAHSDQDIALIITNEYIKYINKNKFPIKEEIGKFIHCVYNNGFIYKTHDFLSESKKYKKTPIIEFNGNPVFFNIIENDEKQNNEFLLLNPTYMFIIVNTLLNLINYGTTEGKFQII